MKEEVAVQSSNPFTRRWTLVVIICSLPAFLLLAWFGDPGRGRAAGIAICSIMFAARAVWSWSRHDWFWVTLGILTVLHVALVAVIPWTSKSYPGLTLLPIAALDYGIVYGCIKLVEKVMNRTR